MANIYSMADVWNNGATTFDAIRMDVTDTASDAASRLLWLGVGGSAKATIDKAGLGTFVGGLRVDSAGSEGVLQAASNILGFRAGTGTRIGVSSSGIIARSSNGFNWSSADNVTSSIDLSFFRDAADTLAQRRTTNAQAFRLYFSFTDASNYTRMAFKTATGVHTIETESAGTGEANIDLALTPKGTGNVLVTNGLRIGSVTTSLPLMVSSSGDASFGSQSTTSSQFAGVNMYDHAGVVGASFQYGGTTAGSGLANTFFVASRKSTTVLTLMQGGVANTNRRLTLGTSNNVILGNTTTGGTILQFEGTTSSAPALKRNAAAIETKLADDSGYAQHNMLLAAIVDGVTAPAATAGLAKIYVDTADGDLKVIFGDGTIKTIVIDT